MRLLEELFVTRARINRYVEELFKCGQVLFVTWASIICYVEELFKCRQELFVMREKFPQEELFIT